MAALELRSIAKEFGDTKALCDIDLSIKDASFVVVVGPSGCGKSTLLRLIAGLEDPSAGQLLIDGVNVQGVAPAKRGVAMVFQSYALYPHLDVFENMAFPLRISQMKEADIRTQVMRVATQLGIQDLLTRKPAVLSGGQKQRVAIGRAIVRQPRLFLLDEPLSNLDAGLRLHMRHEFARLHRDLKTTMIYVTHDQVEAMTLADQIVVLNEGRIEQTGSPLEIYHRPKNLFVASFMGSPRINLFQGQVISHKSGLVSVQLASGHVVKARLDSSLALERGLSVTLGVRPDRLSISSAKSRHNPLSLRCDLIETLGSGLCVYGSISDDCDPVVAMLNQPLAQGGPMSVATPLKVYDQIEVDFSPDDVYVFDSMGNNMSLGVWDSAKATES